MTSDRGNEQPVEGRHGEIAHAFKWSVLGEASSRLIVPAVFLLLARLLTPEDFGVMAAAMVVISLSQAIADGGLGKALVQRRESVDACANAAFWISLAFSTVLGLLLIAGAPAIAAFFGDQRITPVVRVLALQVPLTGLAAIPIALLQRDLAFRELFWVRLITAGLPALASIPLALAGAGYWALVAGAVVGQALQLVAVWWRSPWRPRLGGDRLAAVELTGFGRWAAMSAVLTWGYGWLDALFVARYLGSHDMGMYRIGTTLVTMVFGLAFSPLLPVLYSVFSRSGHRIDVVAASLVDTTRAIATVSFPIAAVLMLAAPAVQAGLIGSQWAGLAPVLALLALGQSFAWLVASNGEAYRAIGRPRIETWTMGAALIVYVAGYAFAVRQGLMAFVAMRVALVFVGLALHIYVANRVFGIRVSQWTIACAKPLGFTLLAALPALALQAAFAPGLPRDASSVLAFIATYVMLMATWNRPQIAGFIHAFKARGASSAAAAHTGSTLDG